MKWLYKLAAYVYHSFPGIDSSNRVHASILLVVRRLVTTVDPDEQELDESGVGQCEFLPSYGGSLLSRRYSFPAERDVCQLVKLCSISPLRGGEA